MEYKRPVWAEINLDAVGNNIRAIKKQLKSSTLFMAVVKADGYGHGAVEVSNEALRCGADRLGVALPEEGVALRKAQITAPIQILGEIHPSASSVVVENDLIPTVCSQAVAEKLSQEATRHQRTISVHVKVDTGMNRLGLRPNDTPQFLEYLQRLPFLRVEGIFTHFSCSDNPESEYTKKQFSKLQTLLSELSQRKLNFGLRHAANSAATIFFPETQLDMVRIGIALYGLHPSDATKDKITLDPALSLICLVSQLKPLSAGEGVSYGLTYKAEKDAKIALLPLGYADGYTRLLSNKGQVLVGGARVSLVGNICMDQSLADVSAVENVKVGDEAVLIGRQGRQEISADELAGILGTINYEITCMISNRVPRTHKRMYKKNSTERS